MLNESTSQTPGLIFKPTPPLFEFTQPTRLTRPVNEITYRKFSNLNKINFNFNEPIKLTILTNPQPIVRNHKIIVDQAPFSVFKSVKAPEREDKSNNNIVVINSNRNHPYNNSVRPTETNEPISIIPVPSSITITDTKTDKHVPQVGSKINRNSSSNAILAQIKSLGPNFKSIFVRPKHTKPIDSLSLVNLNKTGAKTCLLDRSSLLDYKQLLADSGAPKCDLRILPRIEPKDLKINQSVDEILKKFSNESDVFGRTLKTSCQTTPSTSPKSKLTPLKKEHEPQISSQVEKWTCMVCLSKHADRVDICSICGSSRPELKPQKTSLSQTIMFSKPVQVSSSKQSLFKIEEIQSEKTENDILSILHDDDYYRKKSVFQQQKTNPYIKKWTCQHCNFSNDSLKVVCLNCRWVKTSTTKAKHGQLLNDSIQSPSKSQLDNLTDESPFKKSKITDEEKSVCSSCKSSVEPKTPVKPLIETPSIFSNSQAKWTCETCLTGNEDKYDKCPCCSTPRTKKDTEKPLTNLFSSIQGASKKWTCDTCLTANEDKHDKCPCCFTPRPGQKKETEKLVSFFANTQSVKKWTCDTCLTGNEDKYDTCPCCSTPRPGQKKEVDKTSTGKWKCSTCLVENTPDASKCVCCSTDGPNVKSLDEAKKTLTSTPTLVLPQSEGLKFGSAPSETGGFKFGSKSTDPSSISFGSSFGSKDSTASTGFSFKPNEPEKLEVPKTSGFSLGSDASSLFKLSTEKPEEKKESGFKFGSSEPEKHKHAFGSSTPLFGGDKKDFSPKKDAETLPAFPGLSNVFPAPKKDEEKPSTNFSFGKKPEEPKTTTLSSCGSSSNLFGLKSSEATNEPKTTTFPAFGSINQESKTPSAFTSFPSLGTKKDNDTPNVTIGSSSSLFGAAKPNEPLTAFGSTTMTPLFGLANKSEEKNGLFNTPKIAETKTNQTGFGSGGSLIGGPKQTETSSSLFGGPKQTETSSSLFGGPKQTETSSSLFGGPKQTETSSSLFGGPKQTETSSSLFGGPKQTETSSSLFGGPKQTETSSSLFGGPKQTETSSSLFGGPKQTETSSSLFGGPKQTETSSSLFGGPKQTETSSSLFGGPKQTETSSSLFGGPKQTETSSSLFGGPKQTETSSSLFGGPKQTETSSSLFGPKPGTETTTTTTFGSINKPTEEKPSLFGSAKIGETTTTTNPSFGPSLFNSKPTETNQSMLGTTSNSSGSTLFNFGKPAETATSNSSFNFSKTEAPSTTTGFSFNKPFGSNTPTQSTTTTNNFTPFGSLTTPNTPGSSIFPNPSDTTSQKRTIDSIFGSTPSQNEPAKTGMFNLTTPSSTFFATPQPDKPTETSFAKSMFGSNTGFGSFGNSNFSSPNSNQTGFMNGFDQSSNSMMDDSFSQKAKIPNNGQNQQQQQNQAFNFNPGSMNFNFGVPQSQNGVVQFSGADGNGAAPGNVGSEISSRRMHRARRKLR